MNLSSISVYLLAIVQEENGQDAGGAADATDLPSSQAAVQPTAPQASSPINTGHNGSGSVMDRRAQSWLPPSQMQGSRGVEQFFPSRTAYTSNNLPADVMQTLQALFAQQTHRGGMPSLAQSSLLLHPSSRPPLPPSAAQPLHLPACTQLQSLPAVRHNVVTTGSAGPVSSAPRLNLPLAPQSHAWVSNSSGQPHAAVGPQSRITHPHLQPQLQPNAQPAAAAIYPHPTPTAGTPSLRSQHMAMSRMSGSPTSGTGPRQGVIEPATRATPAANLAEPQRADEKASDDAVNPSSTQPPQREDFGLQQSLAPSSQQSSVDPIEAALPVFQAALDSLKAPHVNGGSQQEAAAKDQEGCAEAVGGHDAERSLLPDSAARATGAAMPNLDAEIGQQDCTEGEAHPEIAQNVSRKAAANSKEPTALGKRMLCSGSSDSGQNLSTAGQPPLKLARSLSSDSPRKRSERLRGPKKEYPLL